MLIPFFQSLFIKLQCVYCKIQFPSVKSVARIYFSALNFHEWNSWWKRADGRAPLNWWCVGVRWRMCVCMLKKRGAFLCFYKRQAIVRLVVTSASWESHRVAILILCITLQTRLLLYPMGIDDELYRSSITTCIRVLEWEKFKFKIAEFISWWKTPGHQIEWQSLDACAVNNYFK